MATAVNVNVSMMSNSILAFVLIALSMPAARSDSVTASHQTPYCPLSSTGELLPDRIHKIETIVQGEMARLKIPGLSVAIAIDYQPVYAKGLGMADLENSIPATATTVYRTASIAKPITATAVMQLFEKGRLDLDAPIQKYCSAFPKKRWIITARQLLAHQGCVRHTTNLEDSSTKHYFSIKESLEIFKDDPLECEPGTKYRYSTLGYSVLGCAIEGASGLSYEQYMCEQVFRPAGMQQTGVDNRFETIPQRARGYVKVKGRITNAAMHDTSMKVPGGGLISTAIDLVKFGIASGTGVYVRKTTLQEMWTPQRNRRVKDTVHTLGWAAVGHGSARFVTYNGSQSGVSTEFYLSPDKGIVIAVMANLYDVPVELGRVRDQILEALACNRVDSQLLEKRYHQ